MVVLHLRDGSLFVSELATFAIGATTLFLESFAHFAFILIMNGFILHDDFESAMSKLTFISIATEALLNPVLAHLCLKLGLINLDAW